MTAQSNLDTDIAIVGGGLAGGLIALALRHQRPDVQVALIEAGNALGGNHRWSWFDNDLDATGAELLADFPTTRWRSYSVRFPAYRRRFDTSYNSLTSTDFDATLRKELSQQTVFTGRRATELGPTGVELEDGTRINARTVIDCRDAVPSPHLTGGWQVFMGRHVRTPRPHGIERPIVMDASVNQHAPTGNGGGYRFVYVLPLGTDELFVEDTYYADSPGLDEAALTARIERYLDAHKLQGDVIGGETGVLPVITGGNFALYQDQLRTDGVALAGARGGFVHPLTSYTLPFAVQTALVIADNADLPGPQMAALLEERAKKHWANTRFYRMLGAMLFGAAEPKERYRIFQRFYRLNPGLIERFYAGQSRLTDKARVLVGRPPVSVAKAVTALFSTGEPLVFEQEQT